MVILSVFVQKGNDNFTERIFHPVILFGTCNYDTKIQGVVKVNNNLLN